MIHAWTTPRIRSQPMVAIRQDWPVLKVK